MSNLYEENERKDRIHRAYDKFISKTRIFKPNNFNIYSQEQLDTRNHTTKNNENISSERK